MVPLDNLVQEMAWSRNGWAFGGAHLERLLWRCVALDSVPGSPGPRTISTHRATRAPWYQAAPGRRRLALSPLALPVPSLCVASPPAPTNLVHGEISWRSADPGYKQLAAN